VRNAAVNVKVYKTRFYRFYWCGTIFSDADIYYPSYGENELIDEFSGSTDANGVWSQSYTANLGEEPYNRHGAAYRCTSSWSTCGGYDRKASL